MATAPKRLRMPDDVAQLVRTLHPELKRKIRAGLQKIVDASDAAGKPLRDELAGLRSLRVGGFRIVFRQHSPDAVDIVAIGPRRRIYEDTYRRIRRSRNA